MPFRRGRHLIRVSIPIGSPSRHTPGRMRFSVPGGRIRARRAYLPRRTHPRSRSSLASKHLRAYAPQDLWQTRGFGVASPLTPGDTLCIRPSAWIRILMTFPGCPCLVSILGLSSRAGYPLLYRITPGLNGQKPIRRSPGRSVAIARIPVVSGNNLTRLVLPLGLSSAEDSGSFSLLLLTSTRLIAYLRRTYTQGVLKLLIADTCALALNPALETVGLTHRGSFSLYS